MLYNKITHQSSVQVWAGKLKDGLPSGVDFSNTCRGF